MKTLLNVIAVLGYVTFATASKVDSKWLFGTGRTCASIKDHNECMHANNLGNWADKCMPIKPWGWWVKQHCSSLGDIRFWRQDIDWSVNERFNYLPREDVDLAIKYA